MILYLLACLALLGGATTVLAHPRVTGAWAPTRHPYAVKAEVSWVDRRVGPSELDKKMFHDHYGVDPFVPQLGSPTRRERWTATLDALATK